MLPVAAAAAGKHRTKSGDFIGRRLYLLNGSRFGKTFLILKNFRFDDFTRHGAFDENDFTLFARDAVTAESHINDGECLPGARGFRLGLGPISSVSGVFLCHF